LSMLQMGDLNYTMHRGPAVWQFEVAVSGLVASWPATDIKKVFNISEWPPTLAIPPDWPKVAVWSAARATASIRPRLPKKLEPCGWMPFSGLPDGPFRWGIVQRQNRGL
jgi:hypothetical protein